MYCGKCGAQINDKAEFCTECGARVASDVSSHASSPPSTPVFAAVKENQARIICPLCGEKNNIRSTECISCGKPIDKSKLTLTCPACKSVMGPDYTVCKVCGYDMMNNRQTTAGNIDYALRYEQTRNEKRLKKSSSIAAVIVSVCVLAVAAISFISYKYITETELAMELYDAAYNNLYNVDSTYTSDKTTAMISDAVKQASSKFVSRETRDLIKELRQDGTDYKTLADVENMMSVQNPDISSASAKLGSISSETVKNDIRYIELSSRVGAMDYKDKNEAWAKNELDSLKVRSSSTIKSWGTEYNISYYTGTAYLSSTSEDGAMLIMETYDGDIETLHLEYHDMDENSWSDNCAELVRELNDGGTCVMAAITADTEYSPRIIAYVYRMDE